MKQSFALLSGLTCCLAILAKGGSPMLNQDSYEKLRSDMVQYQIKNRGIRDAAVLAAMKKVPRHEFVPEPMKPHAYEDNPLPIGHGQTISQPYIVAYMSEQLQVKPQHKVLEIGTGSGYQAAILAELGAKVFTIEIVPELCLSAKATLHRLGYAAVQVRCGNGYAGWPEEAPFDRIILTAAPEKLPPKLLEQLADQGILIAPVGVTLQQLLKVTRQGNKYPKEELLPVRFVPMIRELPNHK